MSNVDIMRKYADILKENEYDQDGEFTNSSMPQSEEEFFQRIEDTNDDFGSGEFNRFPGEGEGQKIRVDDQDVYHGERHMGTISLRNSNIVVMRGDYGNGDVLIGAIVKDRQGYDVYFYKPGYEGSNRTLEAALETLIIAAWA